MRNREKTALMFLAMIGICSLGLAVLSPSCGGPTVTPVATATPAPTATTTPAPAVVVMESRARWSQAIFANTTQMEGFPISVKILENTAIDFDWGEGGPTLEDNNRMVVNNFSIMWQATPPFTAGWYRFCVRVDDGFQAYMHGIVVLAEKPVYVVDHPLIGAWESRPAPETFCSSWLELDEGAHTLELAYFNKAGPALVKFWWEFSTAP